MVDKIRIYKLPKNLFYKNIEFKDKNKLINAVKLDWNRLDIYINNIKFEKYLHFLETVKNNYEDYEELIYTLCNQSAHSYYYNIIFNIIVKYNLHLSNSNDNSRIMTNLTINNINKQIILNNNYQIFKVYDDIKIYKKLSVMIIINLNTNDDVIFKIIYKN